MELLILLLVWDGCGFRLFRDCVFGDVFCLGFGCNCALFRVLCL